jgi:hypothetical protein
MGWSIAARNVARHEQVHCHPVSGVCACGVGSVTR